MAAPTNARGYATGLGELSETEARALMAQVAAGDQDAWGQVYEHGRSSVAAYLSRRMPEQADVDDVVQDTFARLPEMAKDFTADDAGEVGAWLCGRVASYTLTDYGHRRYRHRAAIGESLRVAQVTPAESADERESRPLSDRMITALAQLPEPQRRSMQLRFIDQLSEVDAARESGYARSTIAANCVKARKQMRAQLADLAPTSRSWLEALSKKEAVREAFAAVGEDDVPKVMAWLQENGVQVTHSYVCQIRKGKHGAAPPEASADAAKPTRAKPSVKREHARDVAQRFQDEHGHLPTMDGLAELAGVSSTTASKALGDLREQAGQTAPADKTAGKVPTASTPDVAEPRAAEAAEPAITQAEAAEAKPAGVIPAPRAPEPKSEDRASAALVASRRQTDAALAAASAAVTQLQKQPARSAAAEQERSQQQARWQADDEVAEDAAVRAQLADVA